ADVIIHSNQFTSFSSMGNFSRSENVITVYGNYGIGGSTTITNNMISGIAKPIVSGSNNKLYLISVSSNTASIMYNTLYMTNLSSDTHMAAFAPYRGINLSSSMVFNLANNIIFIDEDDFQTVGIYYENTNSEPGGDASDYNNIYRSGTTNSKTGYADTEGGFCASLSDWQSVSSFGANSISKSVSFTSASDLHLSGSSLGDLDLIGTPIAGITTDIDDETRHATLPYMGADENLANPLPVVDDEIIPTEFSLAQNYPNPFNPSTTISFSIPKQANVKLVVYNSLGEEIAELVNREMNAGFQSVKFDASNLSSGLYFYRISTGGFVNVKKMLLLK
ncbi:MAG: T9SS type A sorting domain-containing protein, partial [Bacteroidota bacterium]